MTLNVLNRFHFSLWLLLAIAGLTGCAVGPNYRRPIVDVPGTYRGPTADASAVPNAQADPAKPQRPSAESPVPSSSVQSLGDEKWWDVFQDPELRALIRTALKNNYDVRIAATRVLEAQAQLGITRADQLPSLSAGGNVTSVQNPQLGPIPAYELTQGEVAASAGWNLDFWGKYRRATEAARANLLANEWAQKEVMATLVANLATSYFQLRQLDLELEISRRTLNSRNDSLQLTRTLEQHGINSMLDVRQSEQLVYTAATEIPDFERQIAQQENAISILLGKNPGDVPRGLKLTDQPHAPQVPLGLPSSLLERRPDIREAEANLIAANAQIGVARAAYFPQISLTGIAGYESPALTDLFTGPAGVWSLAASLTQPIFEGGRLKSNVRLTEAERDQMVLTYQADDSRRFPRCLECAGWLSQGTRVHSTATKPVRIGTGRGTTLRGSLQGWDYRLLGSTDKRDQLAFRRARTGASTRQPTHRSGPALSGAWGWLGMKPFLNWRFVYARTSC